MFSGVVFNFGAAFALGTIWIGCLGLAQQAFIFCFSI
jgi:hypothetical protein